MSANPVLASAQPLVSGAGDQPTSSGESDSSTPLGQVSKIELHRDRRQTKKHLIITACLVGVCALAAIAVAVLFFTVPMIPVLGEVILGVSGTGLIVVTPYLVKNAMRLHKLKKVEKELDANPNLPLEIAYERAGLEIREK